MSEPAKTVRVRIAVAVNDKGEWSAHGDYSVPDRTTDAAFGCPDGLTSAIYFIEADVPVP